MGDLYPRIRVTGSPFERGRQYGEQARTQVAYARAGYEASYAAAGISWERALTLAARHEGPIRAAFPAIWQEIEGIAAGSGIPISDILAMNCRTEILWSSYTAKANGECTSFAVSPARSETGGALVGQNWDWLVHAFDSIVVLEVTRDDGPDYVTIVEAGLLAKTTMNAAGLAMCVNTLVTTADGISEGVPFHVMLRAIADCAHIFDAVEVLAGTPRASSGNYVLATADGAILNVEVEPGGPEGVHPIVEADGRTMHTNHFLSPLAGGTDLAPLAMADSYVRLGRLRTLVGAEPRVSVAQLDAALRDHADDPGGICSHPDTRYPEPSQSATIMSVVIDVPALVFHLAEGMPCQVERRAVDCSEFLG